MIEYKWFNCVKNDIDLIEDSMIFRKKNFSPNEEFNCLMSFFCENLKSFNSPRRALTASYKSLLGVYLKSTLREDMRHHTGLKSRVKDYEEEIFERYAKNELTCIGFDMSCANTRPEVRYNEIIDDAKARIEKIEDSVSSEVDLTKSQSADLVIERIVEMNNPNSTEYTKTGIFDLDEIIFGFKRTNYIIIAGRPSMGKTALGITFMNSFVSQGRMTAFVSVEMTKDSIIERCAYNISEVENDSFTNGQGIDPTKMNRFQESMTQIVDNDNYIFINPTRKYISDVCRAIRKCKRDNPLLDIVIVDYLQKIDGSDSRKDERLQIKEISDALCELGKRLKITMIPLAQLSRESEKDNGMPQMRHLKGGSDMEQDADMLIFIHRSKKAQHEAKLNGSTTTAIFEDNAEQRIDSLQSYLIVQKNRNGAIGMAKSLYNAPCAKFLSYERQLPSYEEGEQF